MVGGGWGSYDAESLLEELLLEMSFSLNEAGYPVEVFSSCEFVLLAAAMYNIVVRGSDDMNYISSF